MGAYSAMPPSSPVTSPVTPRGSGAPYSWYGRKIFEGELNVFAGILANNLFVGIVLLTIVVQIAMVELGGKAVKTYPLGWEENAWCLLLGFLELPWGVALKFLPVKWFACLDIDDAVPDDGA